MILSPYQKPPIGSKINPKHRFSKGLAGLWLMNEMSGDRVWDYSGNGNHGTCIGMSPQSATSGWGPGPHGGALRFDEVDDWISIGNPVPPALQIQNQITFLARIFITKYPTVDVNKIGVIVASQCDATTNGAGIILDGRVNPDGQTAPAGHIHFQIGDGSWHTTNVNAVVPLNQWVHIAATRKANENAVVYYNAISQPLTSVAWTGTIGYTGAQLAIGRSMWNDTRYFPGLISDIMIYNRALSAEEVAYLYVFPYCMFEDEGIPAWMVPAGFHQYYYRHLLAGGYR